MKGMFKTGTTTLNNALSMLGYNCIRHTCRYWGLPGYNIDATHFFWFVISFSKFNLCVCLLLFFMLCYLFCGTFGNSIFFFSLSLSFLHTLSRTYIYTTSTYL